ncbi:MAG: hypothetical protein GXP40_11805 [Chloroflexi bacterium]|nr:hypothetical protein [Chloroflexota bacterium]
MKKQPGILLTLGALLLLVLACGRGATPAAPDLQPGDSTRTLTVDGRERSYVLHVPPGYDPGQPVPVVLVFHGGGGNAESAIRMTGFNAQADESGFLAVYPNGSGKLEEHLLTWNGGRCCGYAQENNVDDVAFVRALLDDLRTVADIDPKRIYATGMSNGGIMSYRLACELADQIAAIGPVAGTQNLDICQPSAPVAVIHFHGTDDQHLPYEGGVGAKSLTGVDYVSVQESLRFWVAQNGCDETASKEAFDDITHTVYGFCDQNTMVELYTISGGGHAWPGGQPGRKTADVPTQSISATQLIWEFFAAHPKP